MESNNKTMKEYYTACAKYQKACERVEALRTYLQQAQADKEKWEEIKAVLLEKVGKAPQEIEEEKEGHLQEGGNDPTESTTSLPSFEKSEKAEYMRLLKEAKQKYDPLLFNENTFKLPKFCFLSTTEISLEAFRAVGNSLLLCGYCDKIRLGVNLAYYGDLKTERSKLICEPCCKQRLLGKTPIVVYAGSYESAYKRWGTKELRIIYGYYRKVTRKMFSEEGNCLLCKIDH